MASRFGRVFIQRQMRPDFVVVSGVYFENVAQVHLAEDDRMI